MTQKTATHTCYQVGAARQRIVRVAKSITQMADHIDAVAMEFDPDAPYAGEVMAALNDFVATGRMCRDIVEKHLT